MAKRRKQSTAVSAAPAPTSVFARPWVVCAILAAAVWLVYGRSLAAPFIFDDMLSIEENTSIIKLWPLMGDAQHPGPLRPAVELPTSARPLVNLSFAVNYQFGELDPRGYRAVNIAIHFLTAVLLWAVIKRSLQLPYFNGKYANYAGALALLVALLWAVHPLATEAVVYITQRTELLVALFYLGTLYCSLRYWSAATPSARATWLTLATLTCFAGAGSKEVMVTAPIVVLLFEYTFIRGSLRDLLRQSWPLYLGLAASWLLIAALQVNSPRSQSAGFGQNVPILDWWWTQATIFWMYVKLVFWPSPLVIHYDMPLSSIRESWFYVAATIVLIVMTIALLWRRSAAGWLLASVLLILGPTHLIPIPTEIAAERRMYLPLAAILTLAIFGVYLVITTRRINLVAAAILVIAITIVCGIASAQRVAVYSNPVQLWQEAADLQPKNRVVQQNLAVALSEAGRWEESAEHFRESVSIAPNLAQPQYLYGLTLAKLGRFDEAIEHLRVAADLTPDSPKIRNNLGVVLFSAGRLPEAITEFEKTLELEPNFVEARQNLDRARRQRALPEKPQ